MQDAAIILLYHTLLDERYGGLPCSIVSEYAAWSTYDRWSNRLSWICKPVQGWSRSNYFDILWPSNSVSIRPVIVLCKSTILSSFSGFRSQKSHISEIRMWKKATNGQGFLGGIIYIFQLFAGRFESSWENFRVSIQAVLYNIGFFNWILCNAVIQYKFDYFDAKDLQFSHVKLRLVHSTIRCKVQLRIAWNECIERKGWNLETASTVYFTLRAFSQKGMVSFYLF